MDQRGKVWKRLVVQRLECACHRERFPVARLDDRNDARGLGFPNCGGGWRDVIYKQDDIYYLSGSSPGGSPAVGGTFSASPVFGTSALPLNAWSHLAATYDGQTLRLYVNGAEAGSRAQTAPS
jgi:hypothetical protein